MKQKHNKTMLIIRILNHALKQTIQDNVIILG